MELQVSPYAAARSSACACQPLAITNPATVTICRTNCILSPPPAANRPLLYCTSSEPRIANPSAYDFRRVMHLWQGAQSSLKTARAIRQVVPFS